MLCTSNEFDSIFKCFFFCRCYTCALSVIAAGRERMEIGGLISACNVIQEGSKEVRVMSTDPLLWTMSHTMTAT